MKPILIIRLPNVSPSKAVEIKEELLRAIAEKPNFSNDYYTFIVASQSPEICFELLNSREPLPQQLEDLVNNL